MAKRSKEQLKKANKAERQREIENKSGFGNKKLEGPNQPST